MKLAIVRVRGDVRINSNVRGTFIMLGLRKKNHCVVVEDVPHIKGMLKPIAPFATWGSVDEKTLAALKKKGDKIFKLNPPRKGYGRKGVKMPFKLGGASGDRKEKINDLLMRMI
jgi:large subunit ribosomal protein L30